MYLYYVKRINTFIYEYDIPEVENSGKTEMR